MFPSFSFCVCLICVGGWPVCGPAGPGRDLIVNSYFEAVDGTYVVFPSLFTVEGEDSTIAGEGGEEEVRLGRQGRSNERHWQETRRVWEGGREGSGGG